MGIHTGVSGLIKWDSNTVGELTGWSLDIQQDVIESTNINASARSFKPGITSWTGTADVMWDETDAAQIAFDTDLASVAAKTMQFLPQGNDSSDTSYTGSALITALSKTASVNGMITSSISFQGTGGITRATV